MDGDIILADDKWHHISDAKHETLDEAEEYQFEGLLDVALPACGMSEEGHFQTFAGSTFHVRSWG